MDLIKGAQKRQSVWVPPAEKENWNYREGDERFEVGDIFQAECLSCWVLEGAVQHLQRRKSGHHSSGGGQQWARSGRSKGLAKNSVFILRAWDVT